MNSQAGEQELRFSVHRCLTCDYSGWCHGVVAGVRKEIVWNQCDLSDVTYHVIVSSLMVSQAHGHQLQLVYVRRRINCDGFESFDSLRFTRYNYWLPSWSIRRLLPMPMQSHLLSTCSPPPVLRHCRRSLQNSFTSSVNEEQ